MVVMSFRCGRFDSRIGESANIAAARMGNAEFLDPEIRISPRRQAPPVMSNLSIRLSPWQPATPLAYMFSYAQHG